MNSMESFLVSVDSHSLLFSMDIFSQSPQEELYLEKTTRWRKFFLVQTWMRATILIFTTLETYWKERYDWAKCTDVRLPTLLLVTTIKYYKHHTHLIPGPHLFKSVYIWTIRFWIKRVCSSSRKTCNRIWIYKLVTSK